MAMPDQLDTPKLALVTFIGAIAVLVAVLGLQVLYYELEQSLLARRGVVPERALAEYLVEQQEKLHRYGYIDA